MNSMAEQKSLTIADEARDRNLRLALAETTK
jgi:hypothetical protein